MSAAIGVYGSHVLNWVQTPQVKEICVTIAQLAIRTLFTLGMYLASAAVIQGVKK